MKKALALVLVVMMMFSLAACGGGNAQQNNDANNTANNNDAAVVVDTKILKEADDKMLNTYSAIAVNSDAPFVDADGNAVAVLDHIVLLHRFARCAEKPSYVLKIKFDDNHRLYIVTEGLCPW